MQTQNGDEEKLGMVDNSRQSPALGGRKAGRPPSWAESWVSFTQNTTIHGLRFIWMEHAFLVRKSVCTSTPCLRGLLRWKTTDIRGFQSSRHWELALCTVAVFSPKARSLTQ